MKEHKFLKFIPAIVCMIIIFILSSMTGSELKKVFPFIPDFNWGHLAAYFILTLTYYYAFNHWLSKPRIFFIIIIVSLIYGITDEFHQYFVPSRVPDVNDLIADVVGASIASFILFLIWKRKK